MSDNDPSGWLASPAWPLPAVLVHVLILAFDTRVWHILISSSGRGGTPTITSVGMFHLVLLAVLCGIYWASSAFDWLSNFSSAPEQSGCAVALLRGMLLLGLYGSAWRLAATALAHSTVTG